MLKIISSLQLARCNIIFKKRIYQLTENCIVNKRSVVSAFDWIHVTLREYISSIISI
jgi:hypothetical protein